MPELLPNGDLAGTGPWAGLGGGTLYEKVDSGSTPNDADFIFLSSAAGAGNAGVTLAGPSGSVDTASPVTLHYRIDGYDPGIPGSIGCTISVKEGGLSGTTRATKSETVTINAVETFSAGTLVLATPGDVGDWSNLCVEFSVSSWGPTAGEVRFSEFYLEYTAGSGGKPTRKRTHLPTCGVG